MSNNISSLNTSLNNPVYSASSQSTSETNKAKEAEAGELSSAASARNQMNMRILQSSLDVSIQSGGKSQELVFRAAIDRINELLAPEMGQDALQGAMGQDNSPEGTAERILSLSTGFYDAYAAKRSGDDPDQVATDFVNLIRGGFEKGFNEAKEILQGLDVFNGDIESGVMKTYDLVQKGLDSFLAGKLEASGGEATAA